MSFKFDHPPMYRKSPIFLQALYLSGTYCHKTGTRPPSCKHLDNRLCMSCQNGYFTYTCLIWLTPLETCSITYTCHHFPISYKCHNSLYENTHSVIKVGTPPIPICVTSFMIVPLFGCQRNKILSRWHSKNLLDLISNKQIFN